MLHGLNCILPCSRGKLKERPVAEIETLHIHKMAWAKGNIALHDVASRNKLNYSLVFLND